MAEHELNKIVDDDGEVFNLRDSTKQPVADRVTAWGSTPSDTKYPSEKLVKNALDGKLPLYKLGSEVPSSQDFVCVRIKADYVSGVNKSQVLLFDITSFADGTIVNNDGAYVGFKGFFIGEKPQGGGEAVCVKICAKIAYTQITTTMVYNTLKSDSIDCGPEVIKRTENGVDKYYLSIFYGATVYSGNCILVGQFLWRKPTSIDDYSYKNGLICEYTPNETYPAGEPYWNRLHTFTSNIHANTSTKLATARKLKTNLARSADSTFDGSADQTNIPVAGTLPVGNGGTGKTTAKAAEYNLTTGKSEISDTTSGDDRVVFELASPSESNGVTRGFRKLSTIWTWIKGLLSSESGVNISGSSASCTGNAATATTAQNYNTSTGTIKTALDGKVDFGLSNNTSNIGSGAPAADCISYWGSDNIPNNHIKMVYNQPGAEATLIFSKRSTFGSIVKYGYADKYVYILRNQNGTWKSSSWEKISAGYADSAGTATTAQNYDTSTGTIKTALAGKSDTSHVHNTDANDVTNNAAGSDLSEVTDTTEFVTTNIGGYSSADKKLYRRPFGTKVWPWIKSKLTTNNYRNNAGVSVFFGTRNYTALQLMANHSGDVGYWNNADNYDLTTLHSGDIVKIRVTVTNMANAHFIIETCLDQTPASGATQIHGETIAVYQADPHEVLDGTNADANNFIIPGSYTIRNVTQITKNWPGSSSGNSDYTNLIVTRIVHNSDATPYASSGQISQQVWWANRLLFRYLGDSWGIWRQLTFQDSSYTAVGSSSLPVYTDGSGKTIAVTASSTMGNFIRSLSAETNIGANEYIAAAGASSGQWRYTFSTLLDWINSKNVIECSPANVGTDHKRIQLGYGTYKSGAVGYCCYLVHIFFNFVGGTLAGKGVTVLVSYDWSETTYQSAKCQVLNDNSFSATGYRIVLANFLSDNNTKLHICLGLVNTSAPTTLVGFAFSYCKIMRVACDLNWTESIASDNVGTYNYLIPSTYFMETDTGYKIKVVSYLPTTPDDDTIYFV